jgi:hypothetical protein
MEFSGWEVGSFGDERLQKRGFAFAANVGAIRRLPA